jgi:Uma2 family endonuclease
MAVDPHRLFMSVEEYLELDRSSLDARYEYIDGVVTMLAGGTTNHSRISVNMVSLLQAALRGSPCEVFNSDLRVSISSTRYVLPDASVSCDPHDLEGENDIIYSPRVIVAVLSLSTEATDRGKSFATTRVALLFRNMCSSARKSRPSMSTGEQVIISGRFIRSGQAMG